MKNRFLGGISFLPLYAAETGAGDGGKQAELQLDPAEVAANGDPDWEANDPNDAGTVAVDGDGEPEPDTGKKADPEPAEAEPEPAPAAAEEDDGEPKTPEEIKAAYLASKKALKAVSGRLAAKAADNRRLNEELSKTIKPVADPEPAAAADGDQPVRADFKTKAEFDAAVTAEAERVADLRLRQQSFNTRCNDVEDKGSKTFGAKWATAKSQLGILDDEGRIPLDLLTTALETDDPAKVLFELGSDIEKATEFMAMTPLRRAIAMAKLAETKAPPARKESKTPPPVDPIGGRGGGDDKPSDRDSDEEWNRKEEARERAVAKQRRERGY